MNRDQVSLILQGHRSELTEKYGVRSLSLFGSVARNEANLVSDGDLLNSQIRSDASGLELQNQPAADGRSFPKSNRLELYLMRLRPWSKELLPW
jgi:hypothetical protein